MNRENRYHLSTVVAVALAAAALGMVLTGGLGLTPKSEAERTPQAEAAPAPMAAAPAAAPDFATLAQRVIPSVISVTTTDIVDPSKMPRFHRDMDPFEFFFGRPNIGPNQMRPRKRVGAGSGFFIGADGLALTNNHVIEGADAIKVSLADDDGTQYNAKVVGRDPATDVALIRVEGKGPFTPLPLGSSEQLKVGEWVMAVGNPLNMAHTVTAGVVSAKGRRLFLSEETQSFENFIQTDAAINLGNSGGPLVNLRGEVVGINTAINAAGQNIGFALPVDTVKAVLPQLKEKGKVTRGWLGVQVRNVNADTQEAFDLPSRDGAFVEFVESGGPAGKAGILKGDTIVAVDGTPVKDTRALIDRISAQAPGKKVELEVIRDAKRRTLTVTLGERPSGAGAEAEENEETATPAAKLGFEVQDLTARTRRMFDVPDSVEGVVVTDVEAGSEADDNGLTAGDVIVEVNGKEVTTVSQLTDALSKARSGATVRLYVYHPRFERSNYVILRMP